jgi:hypothetical protein
MVALVLSLLVGFAQAALVPGNRVKKSGDFMSGQLTTESTITVKGTQFGVGSGASAFTVDAGSLTLAGSVTVGSTMRTSGGVDIRGYGVVEHDAAGGLEAAVHVRPDLDLYSNLFPLMVIGNDNGGTSSGFPLTLYFDGTTQKLYFDNNSGFVINFDVSGDIEGNSFTAQNGMVIGQVFVAGRHELEIAGTTLTVRGGEVAIGTNAATGVNNGALYVYGVITSSTPIPTITCSAGVGVLDATSGNMHGRYVAGAAAANCTVTFNTAVGTRGRWPKKPVCSCNNESSNDWPRAVATLTTVQCISTDGNFGGETITYKCDGAP